MSGGRLKRSKPVKWSVEEDRRLREAVNKVIKYAWYAKFFFVSSNCPC